MLDLNDLEGHTKGPWIGLHSGVVKSEAGPVASVIWRGPASEAEVSANIGLISAAPALADEVRRLRQALADATADARRYRALVAVDLTIRDEFFADAYGLPWGATKDQIDAAIDAQEAESDARPDQ